MTNPAWPPPITTTSWRSSGPVRKPALFLSPKWLISAAPPSESQFIHRFEVTTDLLKLVGKSGWPDDWMVVWLAASKLVYYMLEKNNPTRDRLIAEGLKSLILNGFDGIGLNAILHSAGVPKGSFYYFFKSKEEFAGAVLDAYEHHYVNMRDEIFKDTSCSPLQRLRNYFDGVERFHLAEAPLGGCLFGVLSQTAAARSPEFRARLARVFSRWEAQLRGLLEEAQAIGEVDPSLDAKDAAAFLIDCYEGTLVRMKVDGDRNSFRRFRRLALEPIGIKRSSERT